MPITKGPPRPLVPVAFAVGIVCFLLPFFEFQCNGQLVGSLTGLDLVIGNETALADGRAIPGIPGFEPNVPVPLTSPLQQPPAGGNAAENARRFLEHQGNNTPTPAPSIPTTEDPMPPNVWAILALVFAIAGIAVFFLGIPKEQVIWIVCGVGGSIMLFLLRNHVETVIATRLQSTAGMLPVNIDIMVGIGFWGALVGLLSGAALGAVSMWSGRVNTVPVMPLSGTPRSIEQPTLVPPPEKIVPPVPVVSHETPPTSGRVSIPVVPVPSPIVPEPPPPGPVPVVHIEPPVVSAPHPVPAVVQPPASPPQSPDIPPPIPAPTRPIVVQASKPTPQIVPIVPPVQAPPPQKPPIMEDQNTYQPPPPPPAAPGNAMNVLTGFAKPYFDVIDSGTLYRKPFRIFYMVLAILNLVAVLGVLGVMFKGGVAPIVMGLFTIFALWVGFQLWWDRKEKVGTFVTPNSEFVALPVFSHLFQTIGEWMGSTVAIVGFGVSLGGLLSGSSSSGFGYSSNPLEQIMGGLGIAGIIAAPIIGFLILILSRAIAEQIRALVAVANNTKAIEKNTTR